MDGEGHDEKERVIKWRVRVMNEYMVKDMVRT